MLSRRDFLSRTALAASGVFAGVSGAGAWSTTPLDSRGANFLRSQQSADGAWRSPHYGPLREGDALTPLVLWALRGAHDADEACLARGLRWLDELTEKQATKEEPWTGLTYPLFTAAYAAQVYRTNGAGAKAAIWARVAERLRIGSELGWPASSPACGAWGDASLPPRLPADSAAPPDMVAPNLSATLLGMQALQAAGIGGARAAERFLHVCQNFAPGPGESFDDGGFFFAPGDSVRNKAGVAGRDASGQERYHSYSSATCDGVLACRAAGQAPDEPRIQAGLRWLRENARGMEQGGNWAKGRAEAGEGLRYYYVQAYAAVLRMAETMDGFEGWAQEQLWKLNSALMGSQRKDGAWVNLVTDSFEDDPLIATAFAVRAVAVLRGET